MKKNKLLKILTILIIIVVSLISYAGIWVREQEKMENILPEYILGMDLSGARVAKFTVSDETEEIIYDAEGNVTTQGKNEDGSLKEGYKKEDKKINSEEILNEANFEKVKSIMQKRLEHMGVSEYQIRLNSQNGEIILEVPEDTATNQVISNLTYLGKFEIKDSDTNEVLMNNDDVKEASAVYGSVETGTVVYLNLEFNKEGKQKLENITKNYIHSKDEEGKEVEKNINIELDGELMLQTHFEEIITAGILQLTMGDASTSSEEIASYINQASQVAGIIDSGVMPIHYELEQNNYMQKFNLGTLEKIVLGVIIGAVIIGFIYWIVRYRINGVYAVLGTVVGFGSASLIIRYANVPVSIQTIVAIITLFVSNYILLNYALKQFNKKDENKKEIIKNTYKRYASILFPVAIISVVFTFINWLPISSIGMIIFWGLTILAICNYIVMQILLEIKEEKINKKEVKDRKEKN